MQNENQDLPSLSEQGKNLAKFTFEVVKDTVSLNTTVTVPNSVQKERLKICSECPYFVKKSSRCNQCGCYMKVKTKFSAAECPIQKW
tara:strand:- start:221 stop:481 length:261 start_codon:yes stop_codon:yes gene_type:complete